MKITITQLRGGFAHILMLLWWTLWLESLFHTFLCFDKGVFTFWSSFSEGIHLGGPTHHFVPYFVGAFNIFGAYSLGCSLFGGALLMFDPYLLEHYLRMLCFVFYLSSFTLI